MDDTRALHIETSFKDLARTEAIEARIETSVTRALGRFAERLTRVEVHVSDENREKRGPDDKKVLIEARAKGRGPVVVDAFGADLYATIDDAASKMRRVLDKMFDKSAEH
jgi:ribosomal subunit interface protein